MKYACSIWICIGWVIWKWRNDHIFRSEAVVLDAIVDKIKSSGGVGFLLEMFSLVTILSLIGSSTLDK